MDTPLKGTHLKSMESITPYWVILIGIFAVSCSSIFIKFAAAPPIVTAFYRMLFTVVILTPAVVRKLNSNQNFISFSMKQLGVSSLAGVFLALHFAFWITSLEYTSITSSTVLVTLQPMFVMFGGYLLYGETIGYRSLLGALIATCGGIILGYGDMNFGSQALLGDGFALAGSVFVACYLLIGRNMRKELDLLPYTYIVYLSATLVLLLGNEVFTNQPLTGYPLSTWGWFVALAVVPNLLGHSIFSWALRYVKATVVSVSILGEPVGASLLSYIIWNQIPAALQVAGGILIIIGLIIFILSATVPIVSRRLD
ncbi:MAG TPA: DMT family transporter [Negativicutes bacterium]|jgi:drug/metabolite transporter (DMT)-like permease